MSNSSKSAVSAVLAFVLIALVGIGVAIWAWLGSPSAGSLQFELGKTAMQVVAVAAVGGLASMVTYTFQESRAQAIKDRDTRRDDHERRHEALRSTLLTTLQSYHRVKRARRLLSAYTHGPDSDRMTLAVYDEFASVVMEEQLEFEELKRLTKTLPVFKSLHLPYADSARHLEGQPLDRGFKAVESYLNAVLDEYKEQRGEVAAREQGVDLASLPKARAFLESVSFRAGVAIPVGMVQETLQAELYRPASNPQASVDGATRRRTEDPTTTPDTPRPA